MSNNIQILDHDINLWNIYVLQKYLNNQHFSLYKSYNFYKLKHSSKFEKISVIFLLKAEYIFFSFACNIEIKDIYIIEMYKKYCIKLFFI